MTLAETRCPCDDHTPKRMLRDTVVSTGCRNTLMKEVRFRDLPSDAFRAPRKTGTKLRLLNTRVTTRYASAPTAPPRTSALSDEAGLQC